ncbi:MAG: hypothetical protein HY280_09305 [Nitrospinae bacterium]|nr:hypothetical protein [Nitrospinota bacterium]
MREYSPAFLRGVDYSGAMIIGVLSTLLPHLLIPQEWGMSAAMIVAMALAMGSAFLISLWLSPFGAFEIAMPGTVLSMMLGMFPMRGSESVVSVVLIGLSAGFLVQLLFHIYDLRLHGEVARNDG